MSAAVQVFGRRQHETLGTPSWPASKKRQGTKSREVGHRRSNRRYGDLMPAQSSGVDATLSGCDLRVGMLARSRACNGNLGVQLGADQRALGILIAVIRSRGIAAGVGPAHRNGEVAT